MQVFTCLLPLASAGRDRVGVLGQQVILPKRMLVERMTSCASSPACRRSDPTVEHRKCDQIVSGVSCPAGIPLPRQWVHVQRHRHAHSRLVRGQLDPDLSTGLDRLDLDYRLGGPERRARHLPTDDLRLQRDLDGHARSVIRHAEQLGQAALQAPAAGSAGGRGVLKYALRELVGLRKLPAGKRKQLSPLDAHVYANNNECACGPRGVDGAWQSMRSLDVVGIHEHSLRNLCSWACAWLG